ncbi:LRR domain containing protein [Parasponia andersonii]|uniref:LRR domain containing protein n=1 Tax=Parasponia andersonii TaxID=3476 RepID=A0A2P5ARW3_PARAD|nr:LRR domain containing protein [Parasponia andersonii]
MRTHYSLPVDLLRARSLTVVDLYFVTLWGLRSISLPSLVSLTLGVVKLNDEALHIHSLVLACCSLEELVLNECEGVKWPKISSLSLKSLEIYCERKRTTFRIEAVNLNYFLGSGYAAYFDFGLSSYGALTELSFSCSRFSDEWLEALTLKLPVLKCLTLMDCENLWDVKIRSEQLKYLTLERNGYSHINATIDSPNLLRLEYEGYLSKKFSVNSQNLLEAEIKFEKPSEYDMDWYINMLKFLSSLNCSEYLRLDVSSEETVSPFFLCLTGKFLEALIFPKELQKVYSSPLPSLEDLEVRTSSPSADNSDLRDSLMWASPSLETLSIDPK